MYVPGVRHCGLASDSWVYFEVGNERSGVDVGYRANLTNRLHDIVNGNVRRQDRPLDSLYTFLAQKEVGRDLASGEAQDVEDVELDRFPKTQDFVGENRPRLYRTRVDNSFPDGASKLGVRQRATSRDD